jgi:Protein of unknown function (DUF3298)
MGYKERNEIPAEVAAKVLFLSHRTCCVCRGYRKPVQIHHIDEDPGNGREENLAVLCFDCHRDTQIRGGFDRKLDAHQILMYREDWYRVVDRQRHGTEVSTQLPSLGANSIPGVVEVLIQNKPVHLSYLKLLERDEERRYSFDADYPQITPDESTTAAETNLIISAFVTKELQRFRAQAMATSAFKGEMLRLSPESVTNWDDLSITHSVGLFADDLLALEFRLWSYAAGAAHPNHTTRTSNFLLRPSVLLEFDDLFQPNSNYLEFISKYCITDLHAHLPPELKSDYAGKKDTWIERGAGPEDRNFEKFLLVKSGLRLFFDPYSVGSYAEGRREVFIPVTALASFLNEQFVRLLQ